MYTIYKLSVCICMFWCFQCNALAQSKKNKYKLISIENNLYDNHYFFLFKNGTDTFKVISKPQIDENEGCWKKLAVGKRYSLTLSEGQILDLKLPPKGLIIIDENGTNKEVLKFGEHFYKAKEINGKLIRSK